MLQISSLAITESTAEPPFTSLIHQLVDKVTNLRLFEAGVEPGQS